MPTDRESAKPKHTPEPWVARRERQTIWVEADGWDGKGEPPDPIMSASSTICREPDAARIVACVNALAGMPDPEAEIARLRLADEGLTHTADAYQAAYVEIAKLRAENAVLREAAEALADTQRWLGEWWRKEGVGSHVDAVLGGSIMPEKIRAALAKVGGK